jgi:hypothetical protein
VIIATGRTLTGLSVTTLSNAVVMRALSAVWLIFGLWIEQVALHFIVNETMFTVAGQLPVLPIISLLMRQGSHVNRP